MLSCAMGHGLVGGEVHPQPRVDSVDPQDDSSPAASDLDKLRLFLEAEFARQREVAVGHHEEQLAALAELSAQLAGEGRDREGTGLGEDLSVASLYSPDSLLHMVRARVSTDGSVLPTVEEGSPGCGPPSPSGGDHGANSQSPLSEEDQKDEPHPQQEEALPRYFAERYGMRESVRHSFVRKAQLKHEEKAAAASLKLASLKAHTVKVEETPNPLRVIAQAIVTSSPFTLSITSLIFVNVVLLGVQVDVSAKLGTDQVPTWFGTVNAIIVLVFVIEVGLKFVAFGIHDFFCGVDSPWNIFDIVIISVSVAETAIDLWAQMMAHSMATSTHLRLMRSLRLARALRGVRVVRLFRYVSALRTLVLCIISTMASLVWTMVLLVLIFYTFGVIITQLVTDHCRDTSIVDSGGDLNAVPECAVRLKTYWTSVAQSMLTLFMSISGGVSWEDALRPLEAVSPLAVGLMITYVVMTVLAVLNVVTGVFCNTAIESAHADKDVAAIKQIHKQAAQVQSLKNIFKEMDTENINVVSLQEFEDAMSQQKMSSFLQSMGISTEDVWTLFMIMDVDRSGLIGIEEFVSGCMKLCGPAKSLQFAVMSYENKLTRQAIKRLTMETALVNHKLALLEGERARMLAAEKPQPLQDQKIQL